MRKERNLSARVAPVGRQRVSGKIRNGDLRGPDWSPLFCSGRIRLALGTELTNSRDEIDAKKDRMVGGSNLRDRCRKLVYKGRQKWLFKQKETSGTFFFVISAVLIYLFEGS